MAMRMEAAQAGADANSSSSGLSSGCLSNPLIESSSPAPYSAPRFDFYTDPMSAFSGSRRNNNTPHVLRGHNNTPQSNSTFLYSFYFSCLFPPISFSVFSYMLSIYYVILLFNFVPFFCLVYKCKFCCCIIYVVFLQNQKSFHC